MSVLQNNQIVKLIAERYPSLGEKLGYDQDTGEVDNSVLARFGTLPDEANEFLTAMNNVIVNQIVFDTMKGWNERYTWAQYDVAKYGDIEQFLTTVIGTPDDYDETDSPFESAKPTVLEQFMKTELRKVVKRSISEDIWAGAFTREGGIVSLVGVILKHLRDTMTVFMYEYITEYIESNITKTETITAISGAGDTANSQKAYEEILALVHKMTLPSDEYNESEVKTVTALGSGVLILNPSTQASFDVNVMASLFNSAKIGQASYFKQVDIVNFTNAHIIGVYADSEFLRWGLRIFKMASIYNPANMFINYFLHFWVKIALVKCRNAVLLVDSQYTPA